MLDLAEVDAFYGASRALHEVSLSVGPKEFLAVLGRNGVGKTTLMRTIMGLMDRIAGSIRLEGREIGPLRADLRAKSGIGYVPQGRGILPRFTVRENLELGRFAAPPSRRQTTMDEIFTLFPVLKEFLDRLGGNLSGGQQQQLAIGRALLAEPKILLLDEPTEGIQPNIVEEIEDVITKLNRERGLAVVLVEQNVNFARRACSRFVILEKGAVAAQGEVGELTDDLVHRHMAV